MPRAGRSREEVPFRSHVVYSDDAGVSWRIGGVAADGTDECVAVDLDDGELYLNSRNELDTKRRFATRSSNGGETFGPSEIDENLIEPRCQGSALRLDRALQRGRSPHMERRPGAARRSDGLLRPLPATGRPSRLSL